MSPTRRPSTSKPMRTQRHKNTMKTKEGSNVTVGKDVSVIEVDPIGNLLDPALIGSAIMQCLIENDPEGVMEIIKDHLYALNKSKFLREADVPRSTMYQLLKRKNPTIKTLAKIMYATHH
jgi:DNA-binding phage protein